MKKDDKAKQLYSKPDEVESQASLMQAFKYAINGFSHTLKTQRNMRIHLGITFLAIVFGLFLSLPLSSWLAILICIAVVIAFECMNTAVENAVDLIVEEHRKYAEYAKDCAAAAVLVSAIVSVIIGVLVYGSAILHLLELI